MARHNSNPFARNNKKTGKANWYYRTAEGKQVKLTKPDGTKEEAYKQWHILLANESAPQQTKKLDLVGIIAEWTAVLLALMTPRKAQPILKQVDNLFKHSKCKSPVEIKNKHVLDYLNSNDSLMPSTKKQYRKHIKSFFDWLVEREYMDASPIKGKCPWTAVSRAESVVIEQQDFENFLSHAKGRYKDLCELMWHCGARPKELRKLKVEEVDFKLSLIKKAEHKNKKKNKTRQILLNDTAVTILRRVIGNRTTGFVFVSKLANPYTESNFNERWCWVRRRANLPSTMIPYSCRHSFAVRHLEAGVPDSAVASMMGHTSTVTLHRHYSHLLDRVKSFRHHLL